MVSNRRLRNFLVSEEIDENNVTRNTNVEGCLSINCYSATLCMINRIKLVFSESLLNRVPRRRRHMGC